MYSARKIRRGIALRVLKRGHGKARAAQAKAMQHKAASVKALGRAKKVMDELGFLYSTPVRREQDRKLRILLSKREHEAVAEGRRELSNAIPHMERAKKTSGRYRKIARLIAGKRK